MPVHDSTRVEPGIFHDFHVAWIPEIRRVLNDGLLPEGYYALAEQHAGRAIADVLTLHASPGTVPPWPPPPATGGLTVTEAPLRVRRREIVEESLLTRGRTVAIRHVSGHRLVAMLEVLSPANKDRPETVEDFAVKAVAALDVGVHLLVIDLIPPGPHDPSGMHAVIRSRLGKPEEARELADDEPLTLAAYAAGPQIEMYIEQVGVGSRLPNMPLFIRPDRYVEVPLESTYESAYRGMPAFWRRVLEGGEV